MSRFAQDAQNILEAATTASSRGEACSEMTILIAPDGSLQLLADSDWPLDRLAQDRGARTAYRVTDRHGLVRVEGREAGRVCLLESAAVSRTARLLLNAPR